MLFGNQLKRILVIDDDTALLRQISFRLKHHEKVKVYISESGEDGYKLANDIQPDLIILDWMLPDIDGSDVLKLLRTNDKTHLIPVLMLTGKNKVGDIDDAFKFGANAYITKPFVLSTLGDKVQDLLQTNQNSH